MKRNTNFFVAFSVGKWIQEVSNELYETIAKRTQPPTHDYKITFCTDGNKQNLNAILKTFRKDCVTYGQVIKDKIEQKIIGNHKRKVFGNILHQEIAINCIDGFCSKLRARVGCFVRKTRNFAKQRKQITNLLNITQTNHNFIETKKGTTPAILEEITTKKMTWNNIFQQRISFKN